MADDYDLSEGVALVCPSCQEVWWHYPDAAAQRSDEAPPAEPEDADTPAAASARRARAPCAK
ncbi:MAG TPA: hypothetical protein VIM22_00280 [Solirubrobacteraceae bacterium]